MRIAWRRAKTWPAAAAVCLVVASVAVTSGCGRQDSSTPATVDTSSESMPRTLVAMPPSAIPGSHLKVAGRTVPGALVYKSWLVDGKLSQGQLAAPPSIANLEIIEPGSVVTVDSLVAPMRVDVLLFKQAGKDGLPIDPVAPMSCTLGGSGDSSCTYDVAGLIRVWPNPRRDARLIVLNMTWYLPSSVREDDPTLPSEVSASWAFTTGDRSPAIAGANGVASKWGGECYTRCRRTALTAGEQDDERPS